MSGKQVSADEARRLWADRPDVEKMAWDRIGPHMGAIQLEIHKLCAEIIRLRQLFFASSECHTNGEKRGRCFHCAHQSEGKCLVDLELIPRGQ